MASTATEDLVLDVSLILINELKKRGVEPGNHEIYFDCLCGVMAGFLRLKARPEMHDHIIESIPDAVRQGLRRFGVRK